MGPPTRTKTAPRLREAVPDNTSQARTEQTHMYDSMTNRVDLATDTSRCLRGISELTHELDASANAALPVSDMEDQLGRLRVWSSNIGALAKGPASLDHRLRESSTMWQNISKLLVEMQTHLAEMRAVLHGDRTPFEQRDTATLDSHDILSSSSEGSLSSDESDIPATELEQRYRDITNIIDHLFRLSMKIRGPVSRARNSKASSHRQIDLESEVDLFDSFQDIDRAYVRQAIADARRENKAVELKDDTFVNRFASAITARRRQLGYWQKHHRKLAAPSTGRFSLHQHQQPDLGRVESQAKNNKAFGQTPLNYASSKIQSENSRPVTFLSATEATAYLATHEEDAEEVKSEVSVATTAIDIKGVKAGVPPPPVGSLSKEFECSLCFAMCPPKFSKDRIWRSHVFHDLQPYMCTYENCHEGDRTYASRRFWLEHERRAHRSIWRCPLHPRESFQSRASFEEHLDRYYDTNLAVEDKERLVVASTTTIDDDRVQCPICAIEVSVAAGFHNHLANHLERFAIFAVPRRLFSSDVEDGGSNASQQARPRSVDSDYSGESKVSWHSQEPTTAREELNREEEVQDSVQEHNTAEAVTTPLHDAAERGDVTAVEMLLLADGFDVNTEATNRGTAIELAAFKGHNEVVQLLLDHGAEVTAHDGLYGNVLQAACRGGHESTVKILLANGVDVNIQAGEYGTALQAACRWGHEAIVEQLLAHGANVNAKGGVCENPLKAACLKGHENIARRLIHEGADPNAEVDFYRYGTALHVAARGEFDNIVQLLLDNGADPNALEADDGSALAAASLRGNETIVNLLLASGADVNIHIGMFGSALQAASKEGHDNIVQLLLEANADVNTQGGFYGNALQAASYRGSSNLVRLLLEEGADVNATGGEYGSALQAACQGFNSAVVQLLLENGADVNARGRFSNALQAACYCGSAVVVRLLLENGADVDAAGGEHGSALQTAILRGNMEVVKALIAAGADINRSEEHFGTALTSAALYGRTDIVKLLLDHHATTANVPRVTDGPLHVAARENHTEVVRLLLEAKTNVNALGQSSNTALHVAVASGNLEIAQILLLEGADTNIQDAEGCTPLHGASEGGFLELVKLLLKYGAVVDMKANSGRTALLGASEQGYFDIVALLLDATADPNARGLDADSPDVVTQSALVVACAKNHFTIAKTLIEHGARVNGDLVDADNPLHIATKWGHLETVEALLLYGADVDFQVDGLGTALHVASARGYDSIAKKLIENGADLQLGVPVSLTPLQLACKNGHLEVVDVLVQAAAKVFLYDNNYDYEGSALQMASEEGHAKVVEYLLETPIIQYNDQDLSLALKIASERGHVDVVKQFLLRLTTMDQAPNVEPLLAAARAARFEVVKLFLEAGYDINARGPDGSVLAVAAKTGHLAVVSLLVEMGADINESDGSGTALQIAARGGHAHVVRFLIKMGADVNARKGRKESALLEAVDQARVEVVKMLLEHGADVYAKTAKDETAIQLASRKGYAGIVELLIEYGANTNARGRDTLTPGAMAQRIKRAK